MTFTYVRINKVEKQGKTKGASAKSTCQSKITVSKKHQLEMLVCSLPLW